MPNIWDSEPNSLDFDFRGLPCRIVRAHHLKTLNGYVGLPPGHPDHGKSYDEIEVEVHGGLTWAACLMCDGTYRDIAYVKAELMQLAEQMLKRAAT